MKIIFLISCLLLACKATHREADVSGIYKDEQRYDLEPEWVPYVVSLSNACTAFIIDAKNNIGMTAYHCNLMDKVKQTLLPNQTLCWGTPTAHWQGPGPNTCKYVAKIVDVVEYVPNNSLDYVIFKYEWTGSQPEQVSSVRLAAKSNLYCLEKSKKTVSVIGYPQDPERGGLLTESRCHIRKAHMVLPASEKIDALYEAWYALDRIEDGIKIVPYFQRKNFKEMLAACAHISTRPGYLSRFQHDCSVAGGNSGGPFIYKDTVIGFPRWYHPKPTKDAFNTCLNKYWDEFFRPIWKADPQAYVGRADWNTLDRDDPDDLLMATPMHLIAAKSQFLKNHPEYLNSSTTCD